jgi:AraC-like DNA-binding protein
MNTPHYFEPRAPAPLEAPWLKVTVHSEVYTPHLVRIRKRWFPVDMIEKLDVARHGHAHPIYHLIYYIEGSNTILVDNQTVDVHAGQMVLINPDVFHNIVPREPRDCGFLTLMFTYQSGENCLRLSFGQLLEHLTGSTLEPETVLTDRKRTLWPYFTHLEKEVLGRREKDLKQVESCLAGLLNEVPMCSHRRERLQSIPEDIFAVQEYLIENLDKPITIQDLTEISHLSRSHLIGKFKEHYGLSPIDFLIHERIEKAKTYLLHSSKRVKEIAWLCGFQSEYYFSKTFMKRTNMTPGAFRSGAPASEYGHEYF